MKTVKLKDKEEEVQTYQNIEIVELEGESGTLVDFLEDDFVASKLRVI